MSSITGAVIFSVWLLVVGAFAVYFEVESVYCGVRVQKLLGEEGRLLDDVRRLELEYNELVSPDLLERWLDERSQVRAEYFEYRYPVPVEETGAVSGRDG